VWLVVPTQPAAQLTAGQPLRLAGVQVLGLGPDSTLDLAKLDVVRPAAMRRISALDGKLIDDPNSTP
jgi:hypothetical protein